MQTTIEADAANRSVEIIAESEEFYRSSEMQLDSVRAILRGPGGHELATAERKVNIADGGTSVR